MATQSNSADDVVIEYGDQFRHIITGEVKHVHDARPESNKVVWTKGGWDYRDEIVAAIRGNTSMYEVECRGDDVWE
jgi:hypothetical protein